MSVPAVLADALPGFHADAVHTAGKGHTLVTQGTLPARLAPVGGQWGRKMGTREWGGTRVERELRWLSVELRALGEGVSAQC